MHTEMLREDLLASFRQLQQQFDSSLEAAQALDQQFSARYDQFRSNLSCLLDEARARVPETSPLSASLTAFLAGLSKLDHMWKARLEEQDKGLSFRSDFEDSLLVFIYGKVKSGKSSLGNYMAWGHTDPTPEQQRAAIAPDFRGHENTGAENGDAQNEAFIHKKFRTGATEATSSIQSFRLPGLTWVDSPGLHSVRMQNGALAKEYADHADLILYTMKSDAPGRASDLAEIRELCAKEKNIMLLLTGSDKKAHGWDDEKDEPTEECVMKSAADRQLQRDYVQNELREAQVDVSNVAIISVSARYAELHADSPQAIRDSGMGELFATLHQISQQHGVRIKRAVPVTNFKNFLSICVDGVKEYQQLTGRFTDALDALSRQVPQRAIPAIRTAQSDMRDAIQAGFDKLASRRDSESWLNAALAKSKGEWDTHMAALVDRAMEAILTDVMKDFKSAVVATWNSASLTLPSFSVEKVTEQIPEGYSKSTRRRNSGFGGLLGAGVGLLLGPAGAIAGATIGAGLGAAIGSDSRVKTRSIEIAVGDNLNAIREQMLALYLEGIEKEILHQIAVRFSPLLKAMSDACATLNDEIQNFARFLIRLRENAQAAINHRVEA